MRIISNVRMVCFTTVLALLIVCLVKFLPVNHAHSYDDVHLNSYEHNSHVRQKTKRQQKTEEWCPPGPIIVSQETGVFAPRIYKYMFLMNAEGSLPYKHFPYIQNTTYNRLLDTFVSIKLPVLESIPKSCSCPVLVSPVSDHLVYDEDKVTMCLDKVKCTEAFKTNKDIVVSPYVQYLDVVAKNVAKIKSELVIRKQFITAAKRTIRKYVKTYRKINKINEGIPINYVGVHVRRRGHEKMVKGFYGINLVKAEYFLMAMEFFRQQFAGEGHTVFLIVTDDILWAGQNLLIHDDAFIVSQGGLNKGDFDLALLTQCNHTILDYGNFGVVAYTLGQQGITVATDADKEVTRVFGNAQNWYFVRIKEDGSVASEVTKL